jgi:NAD-dependent deacetylase
MMGSHPRILILTGSGISAESGISTFRDKGGIWSKYDWRDVATPEGFARNPALVRDFYNMRRKLHQTVAPNAAHQALARLEREHPADMLLVTQNVDALHELAGSRNLIHMHGEIFKAWCTACDQRHPWRDDLDAETACPACIAPGQLRPDVVWFGEQPYHMEIIHEALAQTDLFVSIGTSGTVWPAAGFATRARQAGARTLELNLEPSERIANFDDARHGPASTIVPAWVDEMLSGKRQQA